MSSTYYVGKIRIINDFATHDFFERKNVVTTEFTRYNKTNDWPPKFIKTAGIHKLSIPVGMFSVSDSLFIKLFDSHIAMGSDILSIFPEAIEAIYLGGESITRKIEFEKSYRHDDLRIYPALGDMLEVRTDYGVKSADIYELSEDRKPINTWALPVKEKDELSGGEKDDLPDLFATLLADLKPSSPAENEIARKMKLILSYDSDVDKLVEDHGEEAVVESMKTFLQTLDDPKERWDYQVKIMSMPFQLLKGIFENR